MTPVSATRYGFFLFVAGCAMAISFFRLHSLILLVYMAFLFWGAWNVIRLQPSNGRFNPLTIARGFMLPLAGAGLFTFLLFLGA